MNRIDRYLFRVNSDIKEFISLFDEDVTLSEVAQILQVREDVLLNILYFYKTKGFIKDVEFK